MVSGAGATPTGTVTFLDGGVSIGSGTLASGKATLVKANFSVGIHTLTASYGGDANYSPSTSAATLQTVNTSSTTTTLTSSLNPSDFGTTVTFTAVVAAVAPGAGTPTGTVTFLDGTKSLANITMSSGKALFSISTLSIGTHAMTAKYNGDANFTASTSAVLNQTVRSNTQIRSGLTTSVTASGGPTLTVASNFPTSGAGTVATVQPAYLQHAIARPTSLDDSLRDEFFSLVARGEEKQLLGIRGVLKNVIESVFRLF
jgi:hypothetical protein